MSITHTLFDSFFYCFISIGKHKKNANIFHSTTQHCSILCTARHCFAAVSLCANFFSLFNLMLLLCVFCIHKCMLSGVKSAIGYPPCSLCECESANMRFKIEEAPRVIRKPIVFNFKHIFGGNKHSPKLCSRFQQVCVCVHLIKIWASSRCSKVL